MPLTIQNLLNAHRTRCQRWHGDPQLAQRNFDAVLQQALGAARRDLKRGDTGFVGIGDVQREMGHLTAARPWSLLEWCGALAGEVGEAANVAKKLLRLTSGLANPDGRDTAPTAEKYKVQLGRELADAIHYAVLAADAAGVDLEQALIDTFNEKSVANNFPERL